MEEEVTHDRPGQALSDASSTSGSLRDENQKSTLNYLGQGKPDDGSLRMLFAKAQLALSALQMFETGAHDAALRIQQQSALISQERSMEFAMLVTSDAFMDVCIVTDGPRHPVQVVVIDAYGCFELFFSDTTATDLIHSTSPGKLSDFLDPHLAAEDLPRIASLLGGCASGPLGKLEELTHRVKNGRLVCVSMVGVCRFEAPFGGTCTVVKERFSDVSAAGELAVQIEQTAKLRHDVRNQIDLVRYFIDEAGAAGAQGGRGAATSGKAIEKSLQDAARVLESISSTMRFTAGDEEEDDEARGRPFDICEKVSTTAHLMLEGLRFQLHLSPALSESLFALSGVSELAFGCGVLNELFINVRKYAARASPVVIHVSVDEDAAQQANQQQQQQQQQEQHPAGEGKEQQALMVIEVRNTVAGESARGFISTGRGSVSLAEFVRRNGGSFETFCEDNIFRARVALPWSARVPKPPPKEATNNAPENRPRMSRSRNSTPRTARGTPRSAAHPSHHHHHHHHGPSSSSISNPLDGDRPALTPRDLHWCFVDDSPVVLMAWQGACDKAKVPQGNCFAYGEYAWEFEDLASHDRSKLRHRLERSSRGPSRMVIVLDNELGLIDGEPLSGPDLLERFARSDWVQAAREAKVLFFFFNSGSSESTMRNRVNGRGLGHACDGIFEKSGVSYHKKLVKMTAMVDRLIELDATASVSAVPPPVSPSSEPAPADAQYSVAPPQYSVVPPAAGRASPTSPNSNVATRLVPLNLTPPSCAT